MNNMAFVRFKSSNKKLYIYGGIWCFVVIALSLLMLNKSLNINIILLVLVVFTAYVLFMLRKTAKEAICSNCKADLFELIEGANYKKLKFNYCPICGYSINIEK